MKDEKYIPKPNKPELLSLEKCKCPCCDEELKLSCLEPPFCEPCGIKFAVCDKCGALVKSDDMQYHKCC